MSIRRKLMITAVAVAFSASMAMAQNAVTDTIVAGLSGQGFEKIEIKIGFNRIRVEATKPGSKVEQVYSSDGKLMKEEIIIDGVKTETVYDANGNVIKTETSSVNDDDDDHDGAGDDDDDSDDDYDDDDDDDDDEDDDDDDDDDDDSGSDDDDDDD